MNNNKEKITKSVLERTKMSQNKKNKKTKKRFFLRQSFYLTVTLTIYALTTSTLSTIQKLVQTCAQIFLLYEQALLTFKHLLLSAIRSQHHTRFPLEVLFFFIHTVHRYIATITSSQKKNKHLTNDYTCVLGKLAKNQKCGRVFFREFPLHLKQ